MKIWDISQTLRPSNQQGGLPVWPGDTDFAFERTWKMEDGSPVNVGRMTMSTHSGTHADAPLHYAADGADAASMSIEPYLGTCLVVDARGVQNEIDIGDLPDLETAQHGNHAGNQLRRLIRRIAGMLTRRSGPSLRRPVRAPFLRAGSARRSARLAVRPATLPADSPPRSWWGTSG